MARRNLAWLGGVLGLSLLGLAVYSYAPSRELDRDYAMVRLLVDVLHEVRGRYVKPLDEKRERQLIEEMINGGLERLDPYSSYINPQEYKQFNSTNKGRYGGIGVQVNRDPRTNLLQVISPMAGTPAYEAGIIAGDLILKIEGKPTENIPVNDAVNLIQGDPDTPITLTILHEGEKEPVDITLKRAIISLPAVLSDTRLKGTKDWDFMIDKASKIGYIRITNFSETAAKEMKAALDNLLAQEMRGLILDLRNNPGGLLRSAVEIADMFLDKGRIVSTRGRGPGEESFDAHPEGTLFMPYADHPMVVLVNRGSASASEILASALQDNGRANVIGERSFGKGSVQNVIEMENRQSALKLTTASYWRPNGKNIHRFPESKETDDWGVKPDQGFEIKLSPEEYRDYFLWRADRDIIREGKKPEAIIAPAKPENPGTQETAQKPEEKKKPNGTNPTRMVPVDFKDRVMEKALEYLRGKLKGVPTNLPSPPAQA